MTALSKNISRTWRDGDIVTVPVAASSNVRQGSLVEIDGGNVKPAVKAANKVIFGVAIEPADNTSGAAAAIEVAVRRNGAHRFAKDATAVVGKDAYVVDDNTVTDKAAGSSKCGVIIDSDDDGVWVQID